MTLDLEALRRLRTLADTTEASAIAMTLPELDSILTALERIPELERRATAAREAHLTLLDELQAQAQRAERVEAALRKIGSLPPEATRFSITSIALAALAPAPGRGGWLIGHAPGPEAVEVSPETFARVQAELDEDAAAPVGGEDDERHEGDGPAAGEGRR